MKRWILAGAIVLAVAVGATVVWRRPAAGPEYASEELVTDFFTSLAALDVEENERAVKVLEQATASQPNEPALWANLAVAHLRLRRMDLANESLQRAEQLTGDDPRINTLKAEILTQEGKIPEAIGQLRAVLEKQPQNAPAAYSLVTLLSQLRTDDAEAERLQLLSGILQQLPDNLRCRCEQARLAATLQRPEELQAALAALSAEANAWPERAQQQLQRAQEAAQANDYRTAATALTFFENLLKPDPRYQRSLVDVGVASVSAVGKPLRELLRLQLPPAASAPADASMTFALQQTEPAGAHVWPVYMGADARVALVTLSGSSLKLPEGGELPFPGSVEDALPTSLLGVDLNFDFLQDFVVAGPQGCWIYLQQEDGGFQRHQVDLEPLNAPARRAWSFDVDADGDLDLLIGGAAGPLRWIRNNGDLTFAPFENAPVLADVVHLKAADLDSDGDVDLATIDANGAAAVLWNRRNGNFQSEPLPTSDACQAIALGDVDRDGSFDVVLLDRKGKIFKFAFQDGQWSRQSLVAWEQAPESPREQTHLAIADLDNNGAVDLVASAGGRCAVWLGSDDGWSSLAATPELAVVFVADVNDDGLQDLVGRSDGQARIAINESKANYGWHVLHTNANTAKGDQRINSFGVGGVVQIRAGNLVQGSVIDGPKVHFGLGQSRQAEVGRIVWPNGSVQVEFDLQPRTTLVASQRLKGSCPWVFAFDGEKFQFTKDFIWRSPLGLRINAQDTAGVLQTEDHIKIPGSVLADVDGRYSLRITAELWETHFFDQIGLIAVDHPADVEVFVDERFVPNQKQDTRIVAVTPPQPVVHAANQKGDGVEKQLRDRDGVYVDDFPLGDYQGVAAEDHWIQFELPETVDAGRPVVLVAHGWVYPTDSSINVAISQREVRPQGLVLEQQDASGEWKLLVDNLGFPAGKNKDMLFEIPEHAINLSRRFRLRTNLEVYWDQLCWSYRVDDAEPRSTTLACETADLRYRGYSRLAAPVARRRPDIPVYEIEATSQRWSDLEGYYTRFGDVRELLETIDDRYVIMNAGDEIVLEFAATEPPPSGWTRDFILVGDGWVKDGDLNTSFSRWVRPLPTHSDSDYAGPLTPLEQDPVYQQHPGDWERFHTRYVTPREFHRGLVPPRNQTVGSP